MEKLIYAHRNFLKALSFFNKTIEVFKRPEIDDDVRSCLLASLIKNNEMCYETALKFLDNYLIYVLGIQITGKDKSRNIIRECFVQELIDDEVNKELLNITTIRNATVHEYDEESALEHAKRIEGYYAIFKKLENIDIEGKF
jgi:nucleotidyltransferase substrate binding protein (TIGR01987 family)